MTQNVWVGFANYRALLRTSDISAALGPGGSVASLMAIDFFRALRFTLTLTFITLPFVVGIGLALALALNATIRSIRGPVIFVTLLPFIITPVIGALSIRWLFTGDGILTAALEAIFDQRISLLAHGWTTEGLMMFYKGWHVDPSAPITSPAAR